MKNTLFILCLLFAVNSQAQVFKCKQGDTTVFSQTPCAPDAEVISGSRLRANGMEPVSTVNDATMPLPAANSNSENLQNQARMRYELLKKAINSLLRIPSIESTSGPNAKDRQKMLEQGFAISKQNLLKRVDDYSKTLSRIDDTSPQHVKINLRYNSEDADIRQKYRLDKMKQSKTLFNIGNVAQ